MITIFDFGWTMWCAIGAPMWVVNGYVDYPNNIYNTTWVDLTREEVGQILGGN